MDTGLQKYRAFVATAEAGSIAHAADRLGYSISSVSRMVSDLEASCGLRLFDRSKAGVALTPDGQRLLVRARSIVDECDRFADEAASIAGAEVGTVRVGTIASVATHVFPKVLKSFRSTHPGVSCELLMGDYNEIDRWLSEGRIDMGTVRVPAAKGLNTITLVRDAYKAVLPSGHAMARRKRFPLAAFAKEPYLALERGGLSEVASLLERNSVELTPTFTVWDDYAVMAMVEAGLGLAILPSIMLQRCAYNVVALPLDVPAKREVALAWRSERSLSAAATAFLEECSMASQDKLR
ncbi:MAG: LysR family transcriptional regulator [Eggerthellaceae bacterium]|nr:LysR family transcriptional regulator [Eggerthellaceae bacterium]